MKYHLQLAKRSNPKYRVLLNITVLNIDKERYTNGKACLFDDYGLTDIFTAIENEYLKSRTLYVDIKPFDNACPTKLPLIREEFINYRFRLTKRNHPKYQTLFDVSVLNPDKERSESVVHVFTDYGITHVLKAVNDGFEISSIFRTNNIPAYGSAITNQTKKEHVNHALIS